METRRILNILFLFLVITLVLPLSLQAIAQSYTISGTVTSSGGRGGIDGVSIIFNDGVGTPVTVLTSGGGFYSYQVNPGWSGSVTPIYAGYIFDPLYSTVTSISSDTVLDFEGSTALYTISGVVMGELNPIPDVIISLSTGTSTITNLDGSYSVTVNYGWTGTITPIKAGWTFEPTNIFYEGVTGDMEDQNYWGVQSSQEYTISGLITDESGRTGMAGVTVTFFDGLNEDTVTTSGGGSYSYNVPVFWSGTVTPTYPGYTFSPTFVSLGPVQNNTTQNFTGSTTLYVISGIIMDEDTNPLSGVTVTLSTGSSVTTGVLGTYSFSMGYGWSATVTPSKSGWVFQPKNRNYSNINMDYTAEHYVGYRGSQRVTVSGAVKQSDGIGIPGVTLAFSNGGGTITTDDNGNYSKLVTSGWSGTVTPAKDGYTFTPASRSYSNVKTDQIDQDYIYFGGSTPAISLIPNRLNFATDISGTPMDSQSFMIDNSGGGALNWAVSPDQSWLTCSPDSGSNSGVVTVSVDPADLPEGTYNGTITVSDSNAANSPQKVDVLLKIYASTSPPFGVFSTPIHGSTVRSSIPVTGWALDDLGVESVKIYREDGDSLAYIGDAVFVEGARPDVELMYPDYPKNSRAGWGYMMLTYFLPNGGNGTYTLHAVATDVEGNEVTLGTKTIICDNDNAVKPFVAIDAPPQGGAVSGTAFRNQGWVLTPMPNAIPTDGSTINVYVDSVNLGNPVYNIYRDDIATLFPGYANSDGARAYFDFDTTAYSNGVHTIYWTATDNAGNTDGIGSRFFTIQNTGTDSSKSNPAGVTQKIPQIRIGSDILHKLPADFNCPVTVTKGSGKEALTKVPAPDNKGILTVNTEELKPLAIRFGDNLSVLCGYMIVGKALRPLPPGSTLDVKTGIFHWLPAPGFLGNYRMTFVLKSINETVYRKDITVKIN